MDNDDIELKRVRNMGFAAHIDAGKTTLTERILFYTGKIHQIGETHEGDAETDYMDQEKERGITIQSAATTCYWEGDDGEYDKHQVNIIDTPGHVDFTIEVERSLRVLDGLVLLLCGVGGVEPQTETVWQQADRYDVPRVAFINKLDRVGADYHGVIDEIGERFNITPVPIQLPVGSEDTFRGVIDLIEQKQIEWDQESEGAKYDTMAIDEDLQSRADEYREQLLDTVVEYDDEVMMTFLEDEPVPPADIRRCIREGVLKHEILPVMCGSALQNVGVQPVIDSIIDYLPSPLDVPATDGIRPGSGGEDEEAETETRNPDTSEPFSALAFKIASDEYSGKLTFVRCYSGEIGAGSYVYNPRNGERERVSRMYQMHADERTEIDKLEAGDIAAVVGLDDVHTGDTICDQDHPIVLEKIEAPEPVIRQAIEPKTSDEQDKLQNALRSLSEEDPTFQIETDQETGQTIISGMGELHLQVIQRRLEEEFNVDANVGSPRVAYKETLARPVDVDVERIKQSGGRGQYGHVIAEFYPLDRGEGFEFVNNISGGVIPTDMIPSVEDGVEESMNSGPIAGYPVIDIGMDLYDGSHHDVDSSETAFKLTAQKAFRRAFEKGGGYLLEPIMEMEVTTPEENSNDVIGDLNSRRATIKDIDHKGNNQVVYAEVPLAETVGYATDLRSLTQGRGSHVMEFKRYEKVPEHIQQEIAEQR